MFKKAVPADSAPLVPIVIDIVLPRPMFDLDVTKSELLELGSSPPGLLAGFVYVQLAKPVCNGLSHEIRYGHLSIRLHGRYEIDVSATKVYRELSTKPANVGNFSKVNGTFYLQEQSLWTQQEPPYISEGNPFTPNGTERVFRFPDTSHSRGLALGHPHPFAFPLPLDTPVTSKADAGRIVWTLEATLNQSGRHWPLTFTREITIRRVSRLAIPQTVPPAPPLPPSELGDLPRKKIVTGATQNGEFLFEVRLPDPIQIHPTEDEMARREFWALPPTPPRSPIPDGYSSPKLTGRKRRPFERYRSTGRDDDEIFEAEGVPIQVLLKTGRIPVGNVRSITVLVGQRAVVNCFDRFRAPKKSALSIGKLGLWDDLASPPIQVKTPPQPSELPTFYERREGHPITQVITAPRVSILGPEIAHDDTFVTAAADLSNIGIDDDYCFFGASSGLTVPLSSRVMPKSDTVESIHPFEGLKKLHTRGEFVSTAGTYQLLTVPVGRFSNRLNGIGGNGVVSPPLIMPIHSSTQMRRRSSIQALASVAEGVGQVGAKFRNGIGLGDEGTRYVVEVGDGDGNGECYIGVEPKLLRGKVQPSVSQQNLKVVHYLTIKVTYECPMQSDNIDDLDRNKTQSRQTSALSILGMKRTRQVVLEVPAVVVDGIPPLPRPIRK